MVNSFLTTFMSNYVPSLFLKSLEDKSSAQEFDDNCPKMDIHHSCISTNVSSDMEINSPKLMNEKGNNENESDITYWNVLDHGFVDCQDIFGDEIVIVNAARVSFGKRKNKLDSTDDRLIGYLLKNHHYSPFRHVMFRFHIKAPEFVMRQWYKHVVGCEWTSTAPSQLHGWNEISGRYIEALEYYSPNEWRRQSENSKQGSDGIVEHQEMCQKRFEKSMEVSFHVYHNLLDQGVAKEQARIVLPLNVYTEVIWTPSLQALFHFVKLRDENHAQYEIREYAKVFASLLSNKFPLVWKHMKTLCEVNED